MVKHNKLVKYNNNGVFTGLQKLTIYSENLKKLRKELRVTAIELADNLGISANSINNYENGRRKPNFEFLELLLQVYNVNLNWFVSGQGEMFIGQDKADHTGIDEAQFKKLFKSNIIHNRCIIIKC